jgi:hypothetical protein
MPLVTGPELEEVPIVPLTSDTHSTLYHPTVFWTLPDSGGWRYVRRLWLRLEQTT